MSRYLARVLPVCLVAVLAGCGPSQGDIEKSIKTEMKSALGVEINAVNLTKQADGGYTGTATAANGDVYDVVAQPPKAGRAEWKALPAQSMVEKMMRDGIEEQTKIKVKSFNLTKQSPGVYSGTADLNDGSKLNVSSAVEGTNVRVAWKP